MSEEQTDTPKAAEANTPAETANTADQSSANAPQGTNENAGAAATGAPGQKGGRRRGRKVVRDVSKREAPQTQKQVTSADAWSAKADGNAPSFADLFSGESVPEDKSLKVGDAVEGTVVHAGNDGLFLDLGGARQQAFYPRLELSEKLAEAKVGDTVKAFIVRIEGGNVVLGQGLGKGMSTDELQAALDEKIPVEGKVTGVNKGGVSVDLGGLRAFCPIGQLELRYVNDASVYLNQTLRFHVLEIKGDRDVVLSRRAILEAEKEATREALAEKLVPGTRLTGQIARVVDFGAFVDLGGIDGLIPTRELSYDRRRPEQVVSTGQQVEVMVQEVTRKGDDLRISLSLKALADDPWDAVERVAPSGVVAQGVVRRLMDFGAFVELAPGIEGLLHVSELGAGARHPSSFLNVGQALLVTVQSVDKNKKRISLAPAPDGAEAGTRVAQAALQVGEIVNVSVEMHERYGIFVQVEGVAGKAGRGLIHARELGVDHGVDYKKAFPLGKTFKAKVIDTGRLSLSVKAIAEDEARATVREYQASSEKATLGTFADLLKSKLQS